MRASILLVLSGLMIGCGSSDDGAAAGADAGDDGGGFDLEAGPSCPPGTETTLSGTIVSPAKSSPDPVYNAIAFIPAAELQPFGNKVTCDKCGALEGTKVKVSALSDSSGHFKIAGPPVGKDIPFAVQIGRWRRRVTIPEIKACQDNPLPQELTRLPRNSSEGDIPRTAIVTGRADPVECVLRKMGVDDAEFAAPDLMALPLGGKARIHMYKSLNGADFPGGTYGPQTLMKDKDWLAMYDQVLLPCEGDPRTSDKTADLLQNLVSYTNGGGKVFTTHYSYVWMSASPDPGWKGVASWNTSTEEIAKVAGTIDQSFPKGKAMAEWLKTVGASTTLGQVDITDAHKDISGMPKAQTWITGAGTTQHFTFNTPTTAEPKDQCGRVVYSEFHVVGGDDFSAITWPAECLDGPLTPQERVIEFMLFDLASCVQPNDEEPHPPR